MNIRHIVATIAIPAVFGIATLNAKASIVGDSVSVQYLYPDTSTLYEGENYGPATITATGTTYGTFAAGVFSLTITGNSITSSIFNDAAAAGEPNFHTTTFNGFEVTDVSHLLPTYTVGAATTVAGFTNANLTESGNTLYVNLAGLPINGQIQLVSAVPLPGALPLFGAAIFGIGAFAARRRAKKAA